MIPFQYARAADETQAKAAFGLGARYLAGGTTLIDLAREGVEEPVRLVDITALPLGAIEQTPGGVRLGALATMSEVAAHPYVRAEFPAVVEALLASASPQIRNMATIGGNILQRTRCSYFRDTSMPCNKRVPGAGCGAIGGETRTHAVLGGSDACIATHASDLAVALAALNAVVVTRREGLGRRIPFAAFHRLPGATPHLETVLEYDELIIAVELLSHPAARNGCYLKLRDRASYEFALVSVAAGLEHGGARIHSARLALGGVGTKPWHVPAAEQALVGAPVARASFERAADLALAGAMPRGNNAFKVPLARQAIVRALSQVGGLV